MAGKGRPVIIEFLAKTAKFVRGAEDVERSTEDIADSLKDATKDADKFERQFSDAMDDAAREAKQSSKKIDKSFDEVPGRLGEVGADAGDEFVSNIGESIGSGDVETIFQDVIGGVVGGLKGPLGFAAAAVGGVAVFAFQQVRKEAEALTAFYNSWQESFLSLVYQTRDALNAEAVEAEYRQFLQDNQDQVDQFADALQTLKIDSESAWRSLYAGGDAAQALLDYLSGVVDAGYTAELEGGDEALIAAKDAARQIIPEVRKIVDASGDATESAQNYSDAIGEDAIGAVTDVKDEWLATDRFLREKAKIPIRQKFIIDTRITGAGAPLLPNTNSTSWSPSQGASSSSRYRNSGGNRTP